MSARLSYAGIALATLTLALAYALSAWWALAPAAVVLGALWTVGVWRRWDWASPAGLALFVAAAGAGLWLGAAGGWLLAGVTAALAAWDLEQFEQRLRRAGRVAGRPAMERRHLLRLAGVVAASLLLGSAALRLEVQLSFLAALALAALAALAAGELLLYLRLGRED